MIVKRIRKILSHFELAPSAFADAIGVPRSSISHLLSGRNKPSLDFVLKVVDKFPKVDLYWLLYGKGEFPLSEKESEIKTPVTEHSTGSTKKVTTAPLPSKEADISKIVVFYADGSFETYHPKK